MTPWRVLTMSVANRTPTGRAGQCVTIVITTTERASEQTQRDDDDIEKKV